VSTLASVSTLYNLTVVNNKAVNTPTSITSGISCGSVGTSVVNSVLFGNSGPDLTIANCTSSTSAYINAGGTGDVPLNGCAATDVFQGSANFELLTTANPGKSACIIVDKAATPSAALKVPAHDLQGRARPQRTAWDIGCYEEP
jgi:hypothetical protein